jgi:hypothetical protein
MKISTSTLGMKISDKKIVVRIKYPETMIPEPMLIRVLKEKVTSAITASTMLDM